MASYRNGLLRNLFDVRFGTVEQRRKSQPKLILIGILSLSLFFGFWFAIQSFGASKDRIQLTVDDLSGLEVGAAAVMRGLEVGNVESIALDDGKGIVILKIDHQWVDQIPEGSRFVVGSLNLILPGNIGVRVIPPDDPEAFQQAKTTAKTIKNGIREEFADTSVQPRQTPLGFYVVIGLAGGALLLACTLMLKIVSTSWTKVALIVAAIFMAIYFGAEMGYFRQNPEPSPPATVSP